MLIEFSSLTLAPSKVSTDFPLQDLEELTLTVERTGRRRAQHAPAWLKTSAAPRRSALAIRLSVQPSRAEAISLTLGAGNNSQASVPGVQTTGGSSDLTDGSADR